MAIVNLSYKVRESEEPTPVKPAAPTNIVLNDTANNFTWVNSPGFGNSDHEYCIDYLTNRTWTTVSSKPVPVGTGAIDPGNIAVRVKAIGQNPASDALVSTEGFTADIDIEPGEDYFVLTESENLAAHVYYALNALNIDGEIATSGDSIQTIPDLKGDDDMTYSGDPVTYLTGRPPVYSDWGLGSIWFDNEPRSKFEAPLSPQPPTPVEISLTLLRQPGTPHEAWYNAGGIYAGDTGEGLRLAHNDMPVPGSQAPPFFQISNLHVKFTASRADVWVDGVFQGFVEYPGRNEPNKMVGCEIGVHTNNSQWEFIAYHMFPRALAESERNQLFSELATKFKWGQEKQLPYAKDGTVTRSGNVFTANYTYRNPLGLPEDTSKTIYRWVALGPDGLADQRVMDGFGKTVTRSQIPHDATWLKAEVQVFDTAGNTWKRIVTSWYIGIEPVAPPSTIERITYSPDNVYSPTIVKAFEEGQEHVDEFTYTIDKLAHQSHITDTGTTPSGVPAITPVAQIYNYGVYSGTWYNIPTATFDITIELDGVYSIHKVYLQLGAFSRSPVKVWGSMNGVDRVILNDSGEGGSNANEWRDLPINNPGQSFKFIIVGFEWGDVKINGIAIYGSHVSGALTGFKKPSTGVVRTFSDAMGTNAFLQEQNMDMIANTSKIVRYYNDIGWLIESSFREPTGRENATPDDIIILPKTSHMWDWDVKMAEAIANGQEILFCLKQTPAYLGYKQSDNHSHERKPVDPLLDARDLDVTTDPQSYKHIARICFLFAARYGSNSAIDPKYKAQYSDTDAPFGLDMFKYFELGNEQDGYWKGQDAVWMPFEMAAIMSACYDGHKGALGEGFGIRQADPTMKFANPGYAGIITPWFKQMMAWWDEYRGPGDYPIDVFNVHHYNSWQQNIITEVYSSVPKHAIPPEHGDYLKAMKGLYDTRNKKKPAAEVWVTETGYDEHLGGVTSPPDETQIARSRHKAAWIMRTFLTVQKYTDAITQYWYGDDWVRLSEYTGFQREQFMTCGYVEGITAANDRNRRPMTSYWYIVSFKSDMEGYFFSHPVVENGVGMTTENYTDTFPEQLWVYAFSKSNGDTCLVAWMGSSDWRAETVSFPVSESTVEVIDYVNHETRQALIGNRVNHTPVSGNLSLEITEFPLIIKTEDIGTPLLKAPEKLRFKRGKLLWDDNNEGAVTAEISLSDSSSTGFTVFATGIYPNAEMSLSTNSKYCRIRFLSGNNFSRYSEVIDL